MRQRLPWPHNPTFHFRPTTFRARITLVMTLLALTILTLVDVIVYVGRRSMFQNSLDSTLLGIAQTEAAGAMGTLSVVLPPPGSLIVFPPPSSSTLEAYAYVEDENSRILAHSANIKSPPFAHLDGLKKATAHAGHATFDDVMLGSLPMRCICYPFVNARGTRLLAIVAVSEEPMIYSLRSLMALLCGSLAFGGMAFSIASSRLSLRLTQPLARIGAVAREVGETNLHARIPNVSPDTELRDVTEVLNAMLERLETAFAQQQALVKAQQRFVADASHELRSPLSNLQGTVEVALRRPRTSEDYQETLHIALAEIQRLSRLVADLLTLSRADAGQFALNLHSCELGAIAQEAAQAYAVRAEQLGVAFNISTPTPNPVLGDRDRLRQVVDNLLDNALKYAPCQSVVSIRSKREGQECLLEIQDYGPGIPPEEAARIFHRFYRTDTSRARTSGGAGLGLAIAQAIVQAHQGQITVKSETEVGTTFCIRLPFLDPQKCL